MNPLFFALTIIGLALLIPRLLKLLKRLKSRAEQRTEKKRQVRHKKIEVIRKQRGLLASELGKFSNIPSEKLELLYLAAMQRDIRFDLETEKRIQIVNYPTAKMDYVQISDVSQLPQISLAEMILNDDLFYLKLANQDLMCPEYYDETETFKRLYILWDVSPSMWDPSQGMMKMPDGAMGLRDTWARAIIVGLLVDAIEGHAEYLLRPFSGYPHDLHIAITRTEAAELLSWILEGGEHGQDTQIGEAVITAVQNIRERQNIDDRMNHILLITDGNDNGGLTREHLVEILGLDIKLYVVLIGTTYGSDHPLAPYVIAEY